MKKEANLIFGIFAIITGLFMLTIEGNYKIAFVVAFLLLGVVFIRHYFDDCEEEQVDNNKEVLSMKKNKVIKNTSDNSNYKLPSIDIIGNKTEVGNDDITEVRVKIMLALEHAKIKAEITDINVGPAITRVVLYFDNVQTINKLIKVKDDFAYELAYGPIELKEIEASESKIELMFASPKQSVNYLVNCINEKSNDKLELYVGKEDSGKNHIIDLKKHNSIALTGEDNDDILSLMNSMIISLIMKHTPDDLELILIDNGGLNFDVYKTLPHLIADSNREFLNDIIDELGTRLEILGKASCKNIDEYNDKFDDKIKSKVIFINDLDYIIYNNDIEYLENLRIIIDFGKKVGIYLICSANYTEDVSKDKLLNICDTIIAFNHPKKVNNIVNCCHVCYLNKSIRITPSIVSDDNISKVINFYINK